MIDHFGHFDIGFLPKVPEDMEIVKSTAEGYPNALACQALYFSLPPEVRGAAWFLHIILHAFSVTWLYAIEHQWSSGKTRWLTEQIMHYLLVTRDPILKAMPLSQGKEKK
jgi:hypothetical protein